MAQSKKHHKRVHLITLGMLILVVLGVMGLLKFTAFIHAEATNNYQLNIHSQLAGEVALVPLDNIETTAQERLKEPQAALNYYQEHVAAAHRIELTTTQPVSISLLKGTNYLMVPLRNDSKSEMLVPMIIEFNAELAKHVEDSDNQVDLYTKSSALGSMQVINFEINTNNALAGSKFLLVHYDPEKVDITQWSGTELRESPSKLGMTYMTLETDDKGQLIVDDKLAFGAYYLVQLSVDGKYDLRDKPLVFQINGPRYEGVFYNYPKPEVTKTADRESFEFSYSRPFDKVPSQYQMPWTVQANLHEALNEYQDLKLTDNLGPHWHLVEDSLKVVGYTANDTPVTLTAGADYRLTQVINGQGEQLVTIELVKDGALVSEQTAAANIMRLQLDYTTSTDSLPTASDRLWYHAANVFDNEVDLIYRNLDESENTLKATAHVWVGGHHIQVVTTKKNLDKDDVSPKPRLKQNAITLKGTDANGQQRDSSVKYYPLNGATYRVYRQHGSTKEYLHYNDQGTLESRTTLQWRKKSAEATVLKAGDGWLQVAEGTNAKAGKFVLTGMQKGQYYLEEIAPPKGGYRSLKQVVPFAINEPTWNASFTAPIIIRYDHSKKANVFYPNTEGGDEQQKTKPVSTKQDGKQNIIQEGLDNLFPKTGGVAIQLLAFIGGILLIILAFLLGKRQRKDKATK